MAARNLAGGVAAAVIAGQGVWFGARLLNRGFISPIVSKFCWRGFESEMGKLEALKILNVSAGASKKKVIQMHRQLMLRNHPDNGGSNYIANKVNEAKQVLVGRKKGSSGVSSQ